LNSCCADERFGALASERLYAVATLCDPRYLGRLLTAEQLTTATGWLVEEAQSSADATAQASSPSPPPSKRLQLAAPGTDDSSSSVMNALCKLLNADTSHSASSTVAGEVERYLAQQPVPVATLAADWWRENEQRFPSVACVAKRYLSAPPTSVASKRLFSAAAQVYTDYCNHLAPDRAEMLLFLKHNLPVVNYNY